MKIVRALVLVVLLMVGLAIAGVWALLFTQNGRDFLVAQVNGYTAKLETPLVLGRLEGNVLHDLQLSGVTVADRDGVWLTVQEIRLVWHPLALWHGVPAFEVLEVAKITISRLPVAGEKTVETRDEAVDPMKYLVYVPRNLRLEDVAVGAAVTGQAHRLRAEMVSGGAVQAVSVSTLEGPVTAVSGTVTVGGVEEGSVDLGLREAPQGLVGELIKLPKGVGLEARVSGGLKDGLVTVRALNVQAGNARVSAQGEGQKDGSRIAGTVSASVPEVGDWVSGFGGALVVRGDVSGSVAVPSGIVSATLVRRGERAVVVVKGSGVISPTTGSAEVSGSWVRGKQRFDLAGNVEVDPVRALVRQVRLVGPGTVVFRQRGG